MALRQKYLTDEEFENLNYNEQREYAYCPICKLFYYKNGLRNGCKHGN